MSRPRTIAERSGGTGGVIVDEGGITEVFTSGRAGVVLRPIRVANASLHDNVRPVSRSGEARR